jgi:hypothetical protein
MSLREEQCKKVCRILDDVLANRPTERDSLIVAVRKAFVEPKRGKWIDKGWTGDWQYLTDGRGNCWKNIVCSECGESVRHESKFCPNCGADMRGKNNG